MNKRNITIIIITVIVLIIAVIATIYTKPGIENIYLSSDKDSGIDEIKKDNGYYFSSLDTDIYLIIEVKHLTTGDEIKVQWEKIENDSIEIIQKNIVYPEKKGSGKIVASLVKKNNTYSPGTYNVTVYLSGVEKMSEKFYISD